MNTLADWKFTGLYIPWNNAARRSRHSIQQSKHQTSSRRGRTQGGSFVGTRAQRDEPGDRAGVWTYLGGFISRDCAQPLLTGLPIVWVLGAGYRVPGAGYRVPGTRPAEEENGDEVTGAAAEPVTQCV